MRARLFSKAGETRGADFEIDGEATIGRHPENEVVIQPTLVSGRHARIAYDADGQCFVLEDLDSLNGTQLDGHRVDGPERLGHLHVITFAGKHDFIFLDLERCAERHGGPVIRRDEVPGDGTMVEEAPVGLPDILAGQNPEGVELSGERTRIEPAPVLMPDLPIGAAGAAGPPRPPETVELRRDLRLPAASDSGGAVPPLAVPVGAEARFYLEIVGETGAPERADLKPGDNLVGRGADAQIRPANPDISRRHAVVNVAGSRVSVRDLGSRNHTYVGDRKVDGETEVPPGSKLYFGSVEATLRLETD